MSAEPARPGQGGGLRFVLRGLSHRNYRLFFAGQGVSLLGSWMQETAMPWLVYSLTGSPFLLGLVSFSGRISSFALAPAAGVVADRFDRRHVLLVTQTIAMTQAIVLGVLALAGPPWIGTWQIVVLALVAGTASAFNLPAAQAFVADMVERKEDLPSAIALNAALTNLARVVGPALAGVLISLVGQGQRGEGVCFLSNGISYLALLAVLAAIHVRPTAPPASSPPLAALKEGVRHVVGFGPLRALLLLAALIGLLGAPNSLLPIFADKLSHRDDAQTLGFLLGATGLGALAGTVYVASRHGLRGSGPRMVVAILVLGGTLAGFAYAPSLWLALVCRFVGGLAMMILVTSVSTLVQTITDDDKRGRVMSLFNMAFLGMAPLGNLLAGSVAELTSAELVFVINGGGCVAAGLWFVLQLGRLRGLIRERLAGSAGAAPPDAVSVQLSAGEEKTNAGSAVGFPPPPPTDPDVPH